MVPKESNISINCTHTILYIKLMDISAYFVTYLRVWQDFNNESLLSDSLSQICPLECSPIYPSGDTHIQEATWLSLKGIYELNQVVSYSVIDGELVT